MRTLIHEAMERVTEGRTVPSIPTRRVLFGVPAG
jgi:hypothetical protein